MSIIEKEVKGSVVLVTRLVDVVFVDDEKMKKDVVSAKEKEIVLVKDDDDYAKGTIKQACKRKRVRKRRKDKRGRLLHPGLGEPHLIVHL